MKTLNELKTSRQTWHNVALYTSAEEATARGFALMYEDERGSVYGIRNAEAVAAGNFGEWDKVAFVPGSEYIEEDEIEQAAAEVKRIAAEYNAAADAYNALTVDGFEHIRRI